MARILPRRSFRRGCVAMYVMMRNAHRSGALLCFIAHIFEDGSHPKIDVESGWPIVDCGFARSFFLHGARGVSAWAPSREVRIFLDMRWCQTPLQGQMLDRFACMGPIVRGDETDP